jgi:CDP-diacylglycerol---glycerol-3-phosphate 3-phosphatidyltransferase
MQANVLTLLRICLVFAAAGMLELHQPMVLAAATVLVGLIIYLDALDGYVARKFNVASDFGALFDIVGDRVVESVFWIYFAATGMVSFWVPMIVVTRGLMTDNVRTVAFKSGRTAFGAKTMMRSPVTRFLVASRFSRGIYGAMKAVLFVYLAFLRFLAAAVPAYGWNVGNELFRLLHLIALGLAYATVALCIIRGLPVLWDGKEILFEKAFPRTLKGEVHPGAPSGTH